MSPRRGDFHPLASTGPRLTSANSSGSPTGSVPDPAAAQRRQPLFRQPPCPWTALGFAVLALLLAAAPLLATAELVVQLQGDSRTERMAVTLVAPDGGAQTLADDDGDGMLLLSPRGGAGEYRVTVSLGGEQASSAVTLPPTGLATLVYTPAATDNKLAVTYSGERVGDEIVVTARKREESLQETPLSITALTEEALAAQSAYDLSDVADFTPNLDISVSSGLSGAPSEATIYIRGIGQIDTAIFSDPGVGLYVDGVYLSRSQGGVLDLLDVERVEVLRGPQGTLFGKNTTGGAISLISKKPDATFAGSAEATVGSYDRRDANGRVNGALGDSVFGSLAVASSNRDGFTESLATGERFNDDNRDSARGALRWLASDRVVADLSVDVMRERESALDLSLIGLAQTPILAFYNSIVGSLGLPTMSEEFITGDLTRSYSAAPRHADGDVLGTSLTVDWQRGDVAVRSITAYRDSEFDIAIDADGTPLAFLERAYVQNLEQRSQELQLSGIDAGGRLTWLIGALYFNETSREADLATVFGEILPSPDFTLIDLETTSYALFGEGTYNLSDRLSATLGLRYTYEEKTFDFFREFASGAPSRTLANEDDWDAVSPRFILSYQARPDLMLYTSASRGFKSGGFNGRPQRNALDPYDPELIWAYEAGFKLSGARGFRLNGAAFFNDYTDIQFAASLIDDDGNAVFVLQNAGRAEAWGGELELNVRPTDGWWITASVGYIDNEYTELRDVEPNGVTLDSKFPKTPEWSFTFSPQYTFNFHRGGSLTLRGDYSYRSEIFNDISNSPLITQEAYDLVHGRIAWTPASGRWEVALFGTNLTDEEYLEHGFFVAALGPALGVAGRPREWGLSTRLRF